MAIQWTPDLAVGDAEIDRQHQELFAAVDALLEAMRVGKGKQEVEALLAFLERYVIEHFGAEERTMAQAKYPGLARQLAEHRAFTTDLALLGSQIRAEGARTTLVLQVNARVCGWLREHISKTDKALGRYLASGRSQR
jgi:hemerythrin